MLARRSLAVTSDKAFAKSLRAALMATGALVDVVESVAAVAGDAPFDLVVVHLPDNQMAPLRELGAKLGEDAWVVVVLGTSDLSATVEAMQAIERVAGVMVADRFRPHELAAGVTRLLHGDIFGLDKVVPYGTRIYSALVGDYQEKSMCISQLSEFAAAVGVRRKYREALDQCADEMLMNALYDAPVDASGRSLFVDVPVKERIGLKLDSKAVVQYACDGQVFALSVRDAYGSFARDTLLKYLHKCLHSEQQIDRKAGGAGLGLYLMANSASTIIFNLLPGVATEVICVFDIAAPKLRLENLGVFGEKVDAAGRLVAGPVRVGNVVERRHGVGRAAAGTPPALMAALAAAIVLLVVMVGLVAYPRLVTRTGSVVVSTDPPGAVIEIDGRVRGTTEGGPLTVDGLEIGSGHRVVARREGHDDADSLVEVTRGQTSLSLALPTRRATIVLESNPSGAKVLRDGAELGVTPLTLDALPPGQEVELVLRRHGYRETPTKVRVPPPGGQAMIQVSMPIDADLASVDITSTPPGAAIRQNGERLAGLTTPVSEHLVEAGKRLEFTLELAGHMPATVAVELGRGQRGVPVGATLSPGGALAVTANLPARVTVSNTKTCAARALPLDCPLENGSHRVKLEGRDPYLSQSFDVVIDGAAVRRELRFGTVTAKPGFTLEGAHGARALALPEGAHQVVLVSETGERQTLSLDVRSGTPLTVP
jgi:hypothetical protein